MDVLINYAQPKDLDFLFKDGITKSYFKKFTDLLATKLKDDTIEEIRSNNITLLHSLSPGTVISNFMFPINEKATRGHLVVIDNNVMKHCEFNSEESAAAILHEFGHVFNHIDDPSQKEFYADYYAKRLGFGKFLSSSLSKFLNKEIPFIDDKAKEEIGQRIAALNDTAQVELVGKLKTLNP